VFEGHVWNLALVTKVIWLSALASYGVVRCHSEHSLSEQKMVYLDVPGSLFLGAGSILWRDETRNY
jgi:hypothetical protein